MTNSRLGLQKLIDKRNAGKEIGTDPIPSQMETAEPSIEKVKISEEVIPSDPKSKPAPTRNKIKLKPKPSNPSQITQSSPVPKRKAPFEERYQRITTYLEMSIYERVQQLHKQGDIDKISNLINSAVKNFLKDHYT